MAKKRLGRKILSQVLAVSMVFSLWGGPVNALAAETPAAVEGSTEAMTEAQTTEETTAPETQAETTAETKAPETEKPGSENPEANPAPEAPGDAGNQNG